jgi:hypothetical protein
VVRRIVTLIVTFSAVLGLGVIQVQPTLAQETKKASAPAATTTPAKPDAAQKPAETKSADTKSADAKSADTAKAKEAPQATEAPLPPIPKEVEEKLAAARKAVAELIVAAQDAGLVETSIDPPPILDILITGRATDARTLKNPAKKKPYYGVSPEVFAAWFTGYQAPGFENIDHVKEVRIIYPSDGLKAYFDQRAVILREAIAEVRKAKGPAPAVKPAEKKAETKPAEKKAETKPAEKKAETKPAEKPAEPKKK